MRAAIYLDCNATTPMKPAAIAAVVEALGMAGNASSIHRVGRMARRMVEDARESVAALVNVAPAQVVFTGSGTEANNWALRGTCRRIVMSAVEHDSVRAAAAGAALVPVDREGVVDLGALDAALARDEQPALVSVMAANNETGVIQPVAEVVQIAHAHGALVHCDAAQAIGRIPVDFAGLGIDLMTLSAHKLGGPQGVGALVIADRVELAPLLLGGGQERGRRAGTEAVPAIAGFGAAARLAVTDMSEMSSLAALRDGLEARLKAAAPATVVFGVEAARLPNTSCVAMPGVTAETQVMAFDLAGIALSAGAACSSGKVRSSRVLAAMGVEEGLAGAAIRVSLGWVNCAADIDRFVETWVGLWARLGASRAELAAPAA